MAHPQLLHTVLDAVDVRREAEFWRELLGLVYRPGDEVPDDPGADDDLDWLVLTARRRRPGAGLPAGRRAGPHDLARASRSPCSSTST